MHVTFDEEPTPEDLEHYGVISMKWQHHRVNAAQAKAAKAKNKLDATEKGTKAYVKASNKYQKAQRKAYTQKAVYEGIYTRSNARKLVERQSMGKTLAQSLLMGSFGAMRYNDARAAGVSKGESIVKGIMGSAVNHMFFNLPSALTGVHKAHRIRKSLKSKV